MSLSRIHERFLASLSVLVLLWLAVYGPGLFRPPLMDDADSSHAEAAREILLRHDWVTLYQNGIRYLQKAPLPYWGMALGMKIFGVSDWAARLWLGFGMLLLAVFVYQFGRRFLTAKAGFWAGIALLASCGPYEFTRILIPDMIVGLWIGLSLYFFLDGWRSSKPSVWSCWGFAAAIALNVLTKGLIGIVFPCAIIFVFLMLVGDLRHILKMRIISSTAVFLVIAAPWHIFAAIANPPAGEAKGFLWFYFVNEQFLRYLGKRIPMDYGTVPLVLFYGLLIVWLLPWSFFLPQALAQVRIRLLKISGVRESQEAVLLLLFCWAAVVMLFFSFSTRQEYYLAPALPALYLIVGIWLARESEAPIGSGIARAGRVSATALFVVGVVIAGVTGTLAAISHKPQPGVELADLLSKQSGPYVLSLGHFLDLTGAAMSVFRGPLLGTALAFLLGTGLNWWLRRRGRTQAANAALVVMLVVFIECAHVALCVFYPVLGSQPLAVAIQKVIQPGEQIVSDGEYAHTCSVNFYTGKSMLILNGRITGLWLGSLFPDSPDIFLDDAQFANLWAGSSRVYFVTGDKGKLESLARIAQVYVLAKSGGKFVLTNQPTAN